VATQDCIDGGITLLLRCPGYLAPEECVENVTVDAYISPGELRDGGQMMHERVALLIQSFGEDLVVPHLKRFSVRCQTENLVPPPKPGTPLLLSVFLSFKPDFSRARHSI
jgi:hypothetical protein